MTFQNQKRMLQAQLTVWQIMNIPIKRKLKEITIKKPDIPQIQKIFLDLSNNTIQRKQKFRINRD